MTADRLHPALAPSGGRGIGIDRVLAGVMRCPAMDLLMLVTPIRVPALSTAP